MKMTEPCNLGLLALISAAGEISYEELKQRYLPPEQPGVIQGVTASFDNDIKTLEKEKYISVHGNIIRFIRKRLTEKQPDTAATRPPCPAISVLTMAHYFC